MGLTTPSEVAGLGERFAVGWAHVVRAGDVDIDSDRGGGDNNVLTPVAAWKASGAHEHCQRWQTCSHAT